MDLLLFTKHLSTVGDLPLPTAADRVAAWGFDGVDLTVREGGYVDPDEVHERLPEAVETFAERGVSVPMITTRITDATDRAERVFAAADACGVEYLKLGYWPYDGLGTLKTGLDEMAADLDAIADLAAGHDVVPAVHVHSGHALSADGMLLADLLSEHDGVAAYPDLGHLAVEGGLSGWQMALERLAPQTAMLGVKDYGWRRRDGEWSQYPVPLGEGLVDWNAAFEFLATTDFDGPVSLHAEYGGPLEKLATRIQDDRDYVRKVLGHTVG